MTTTHLFVELLVIGFGALIWIGLLVAVVTGADVSGLRAAIEGLMTFNTGSFVVFLPAAYVLGILTDRVADWALKGHDRRHREAIFGTRIDNYFESRRTLVMEGGQLWEQLEYLRSRLRICRGWAANSGLIATSLAVYWVWLEATGHAVPRLGFVFAELATIGILVLCFLSWSRMNRGEYEKTERLAEWLAKRAESPSSIPPEPIQRGAASEGDME